MKHQDDLHALADRYKRQSAALLTRLQREDRYCECPACRIVQHASSCAVHNAPALPIGKCTCGAVEVLE